MVLNHQIGVRFPVPLPENVIAFMREHGIDSWRELIRRSQDDIEWFWDAVVRHLGIEFFTPYEQVLDTSRGPAWPRCTSPESEPASPSTPFSPSALPREAGESCGSRQASCP